MISSTAPQPSPQVLAVRRFARWAILQYIQHLETDSIVAHMRMEIFRDAVNEAERNFPSVGLDTEVLLAEGFSSVPYIWGRLRMAKDVTVQAEAVWSKVLEHLKDDPGAIPQMDTSRSLDRQQIDALQRLLDGFEWGLNELVTREPGVSIMMGFIHKEQENQMLGHGGYLGKRKSLLLKALRSRRNPLPIWEIQKGDGTFIVTVVPEVLRMPLEQWFMIRATNYPSATHQIPFMVDMPTPEDFESMHVVLGLMITGIDESTYVGEALSGVLEYVEHSLLLQHEGD